MLAIRTHNLLNHDPMTSMLNEWARLWPSDSLLQGASTVSRSSHPRLVMREHEDRHELFAQLPGLKKEQLSLEVDQGHLVLRRVQEATEGEGEVTQPNRQHPFQVASGFERRVRLPKDSDLSQISAKLEDGILEITIPKLAPPTPKAISISGS